MDKQAELVDSVLCHVKEILETVPSEDLQNVKEAYAKVSSESEQQRYDNILAENLTEAFDHIRQWHSHTQGTEWIESEMFQNV